MLFEKEFKRKMKKISLNGEFFDHFPSFIFFNKKIALWQDSLRMLAVIETVHNERRFSN